MNIKELAHKAGLPTYNPDGIPTKLEKFAELVAAHEREECAKLCDNWECDEEFVDNIADAIRARSKA